MALYNPEKPLLYISTLVSTLEGPAWPPFSGIRQEKRTAFHPGKNSFQLFKPASFVLKGEVCRFRVEL
jgi:hypothetical protein